MSVEIAVPLSNAGDMVLSVGCVFPGVALAYLASHPLTPLPVGIAAPVILLAAYFMGISLRLDGRRPSQAQQATVTALAIILAASTLVVLWLVGFEMTGAAVLACSTTTAAMCCWSWLAPFGVGRAD